MLNRRPIFINALARGGSNILMNLLLSHPDVCLSSAAESNKVFKGTRWDSGWRIAKKRICYDLPIRVLTGRDFFSSRVAPRKPLPPFVRRYIDHILYHGRFNALIETHNLYKFDTIAYTREELASCRLLTKALNGLVYTVEMFGDMYPDAVFFGLVRNGLAVCEGCVRRGWSAEDFARTYKSVVEKMFELNAQMPNYYIVRYEDMVANPLEFTHKIYKHAELDIKHLQRIRLQSKPIMDREGKHSLNKGYDRQVFWYDLNSLQKHIRSDTNENQIRQLSADNKAKFLSIGGGIMEELGYVV